MADGSLMGSHQPAFEERDNLVHSRHQLRRSLLFTSQKRDLVRITLALQGEVAQPAIGVDEAAGCDRFLHKRNQALGRSVYNLAHANPTDSGPIFLSSHNNQCFLQIEPTEQAFLQTADIAFIHLDSARQQIPSRSYHGAAQSVQHRPSGPVLFQPQLSLQPQGARPVLLGRYPPHGAKPHRQRGSRVLEDRSGGDRSLAPTPLTLPQTSHRPRLLRSTAWTAKTGWPPESFQVRSTRFLCSELRL